MKAALPKLNISEIWSKYKFVVLILLAGILLMLLPTGGNEQGGKTEEGSRETFSLEETERKMEEVLGKIQGTGKLQVMLTLKSGPRVELAEDVDRSQSGEDMSRRSETVTLNRGSGSGEDVYVTNRFYPIYQGALVVCEGAEQAAVRLAVTEAVAALTGLSSDRITVVKWKS